MCSSCVRRTTGASVCVGPPLIPACVFSACTVVMCAQNTQQYQNKRKPSSAFVRSSGASGPHIKFRVLPSAWLQSICAATRTGEKACAVCVLLSVCAGREVEQREVEQNPLCVLDLLDKTRHITVHTSMKSHVVGASFNYFQL